MRCSKPGRLELPNTRDVFLHPLGDFGDGPPFFIGHGHERPPLDRALLMELNVEPFPMVPFPRGFDQEDYIVFYLSQRKTD